MGVRRTVFLGGLIFWTGQKAILTLFILKFLFKLAILYLKFHKCQIPRPAKCLVLPIGADTHVPVNIYRVFFISLRATTFAELHLILCHKNKLIQYI